MTIKRKAQAKWQGSGKEGKGTLTTDSTVLNSTQYSYSSRFEDGIGTNPEELVAAAHAGCFSMKLAFNLQKEGYTADSIQTEATVKMEEGSIVAVTLNTTASIPNIQEDEFIKLAEDAKANCPISKLLNAEIELTALLKA